MSERGHVGAGFREGFRLVYRTESASFNRKARCVALLALLAHRDNLVGCVAHLDRALPCGAVRESIIPCKKQGILISPGSQESQQKLIETQPNWHGASYENLDRARRAWGALRVI